MLAAIFAMMIAVMLSSLFKPDRATLSLGLAALAFAGLQVVIHQWRTSSEERDHYLKRQHDLFDRRWKIYAAG